VPYPSISVVISTRNRPEDLERCLQSLTDVGYPRWDILIVDQSDDTRTRDLVSRFATILPCLQYRHMREKGLCRSRNVCIEESRGDIIAFLDDDCTVTTNWLEQVARVFERHPEAALVFGMVSAAPHDWRRVYVPRYEVLHERILRGTAVLPKPGGFGASMYARHSLLRMIGPFDVLFGAGAYFPSNDDTDYACRTLLKGGAVVETPQIVVQHYGARDFETGAAARMFQDIAFSQGAMHMKYLRCGHPHALWLIMLYLCRYVLRVNLVNLVRRKGPSNLAWLARYLHGIITSFRFSISRRRLIYNER